MLLKRYFDRHFRFEDLFNGHAAAEKLVAPERKKASKAFKRVIFLLKSLSYVCGAAFVLSFFWDFGPQHRLPDLWGMELPLTDLIRTMSVSGIIGFGTNWLAIKMLFRPVYKRPIWGQGLIPAQKDRIVWQLAGGIHQHILNEEMIRSRIEQSGLIGKVNTILLNGIDNLLQDEEFKREIKAMTYKRLKEDMGKEEVRLRFSRLIDEKLDEHLQSGLKAFVFKTYKRLSPQDYDALINNLLDRVPTTVVSIIEEMEKESAVIVESLKEKEDDMEAFFSKLVLDILERIDIQLLLSKQMSGFDEAKLEQMIWSATNEQLLYIQYLGTILGILGGLLIWQPVLMLGFFGTLLVVLLLLDLALYSLFPKKFGKPKS
jgi:uncharacterized membrane protein YheB (UPF0754 family)